jgi:CHAT domain-containing protein
MHAQVGETGTLKALAFCLIIAVLAWQPSAVAAGSTFTLDAQQRVLLEIRSAGQALDIVVNEHHVDKRVLARPALVFTDYLVLGPYAEPTNVNVVLRPRQAEQVPAFAEVKQLIQSQPSITRFAALQQRIAAFANSASSDALLADLATAELSNDQDAYLKVQLLYNMLNHPQWSAMQTLQRRIKLPSAPTLIAKCTVLTRYLAANEALTHAFFLESVSKLAMDLYMFQRDVGDLNDEHNASLSTSQYVSHCRPLIEALPQQHPAADKADTSSNWSLVSDADALFNYVLQAIPQQTGLLQARLINNVWLFFNFNDQHAMAEKLSKDALALVRQQAEPAVLLELDLLNNLFSSLSRQGKFAETLHYATQALNLAQDQDRESRSAMQLNMGFIYYYVGEFDIAKRYFELAINSLVDANSAWNGQTCEFSSPFTELVAYRIGLLGSVYRKLENYPLALQYHRCGADILNRGGSLYGLVLNNEIALDAFAQQDYALATSMAAQILADQRAITAQRLDALTMQLGAQIATHWQSVTPAHIETIGTLLGYPSVYATDFATLDVRNYPLRQIAFLQQLIILHSLKAEYEQVAIFAQKAFAIINQNKTRVTNPIAWTAAQYSLTQHYMAALSRQADSDRELAATLYPILETHYSLQPQQEQRLFAFEQQSMPQASNTAATLATWFAAERQAINAASSPSNSVKNQVDQARDAALSQLRWAPANVPDVPLLSLSDVQQRMGSQELFLRYFVVDDAVQVLMIDKQHYAIKTLGSLHTLEQRIADAGQNLHSPRHVMSLWAREFIPLTKALTERYTKLVIVPDKGLHKLAFAMLNLGAEGEHYQPLAEAFQTVMATSASSYYRDTAIQHYQQPRVAIFAAPTSPVNELPLNPAANSLRTASILRVSSLSGTLLEATNIATTLQGVEILSGIKEQATNAFLMANSTRRANILHIATHGYFNPDYPEVVGLITSAPEHLHEQGFLSLSELLSQPSYNDLVVISGCDTQRGKYYKGSGMRSMTRGFLTQGAGSVIGTLWPVDDIATAKFMSIFYAKLKITGNSAQALQQAQITFSQLGRYRNPLNWAGFVLTVANRQHEHISVQ